jgi:hypothetical protein
MECERFGTFMLENGGGKAQAAPCCGGGIDMSGFISGPPQQQQSITVVWI